MANVCLFVCVCKKTCLTFFCQSPHLLIDYVCACVCITTVHINWQAIIKCTDLSTISTSSTAPVTHEPAAGEWVIQPPGSRTPPSSIFLCLSLLLIHSFCSHLFSLPFFSVVLSLTLAIGVSLKTLIYTSPCFFLCLCLVVLFTLLAFSHMHTSLFVYSFTDNACFSGTIRQYSVIRQRWGCQSNVHMAVI